MFRLQEIRPQVFHLQFYSRRELGMTFLRYTEFYESKFDHIRGQKFTLVEQMAAYTKDSGKDDWTYTTDWSGYNIPTSVIHEVRTLGIRDHNHYDSLMDAVFELIQAQTLGKPSYLIGTSTSAEVSTLDHELTHALWYLNQKYRDSVIIAMGDHLDAMSLLTDKLVEAGYPDKVIWDEINAYLTTGLHDSFWEVDRELLLPLQRDLQRLHSEYFPEFMVRE